MPGPITDPRITRDVSPEIAGLEAELLRIEYFLSLPQNRARQRGGRKALSRRDEILSQLQILRNPGGDPPDITPRPDAGPTFSLALGDPTFAGKNLDTGRVGVGDLKLISYPSPS